MAISNVPNSSSLAILPGYKQLRTPAVMGSGDYIFGTHGVNSRLIRHTSFTAGRAMVESKNWDTLKDGPKKWFSQGVPCMVHLCNFALHGNAGITDGNLNPSNPAPVTKCHGIRLYSLAPRIIKMTLYDMAGQGIDLDVGDDALTQYDLENSCKAVIANNFIQRTSSGGLKCNLSESYISANEIVGSRGIGLHLTSTACQCNDNHTYGHDISTQVGVPGLGYSNYFGDHQTADCRIGFLNYGPGTKCDGLLRVYNCTETAIQTYATMRASNVFIDAAGSPMASGTGIKIHDNAPRSKFGGEMILGGTAVGVHYPSGSENNTNYSKLDLDIEGGDKSILCEQPVNYTEWNITATDNDLSIEVYGQHNQIKYIGNGTITNNTDGPLHASNKIWKNGDLITDMGVGVLEP